MEVIILEEYNHFPRIAAQFSGRLEEILDAGVITTIEVADPLTPVDTGLLVSNKTIERGKGARTITWNQHYAAYQEYGTSRGVPANLFATEGAEAGIEQINAELRALAKGLGG